ncbi:hypothetical protein BN3087_520010 [Sulfurovum sp. enrichment culture clone C5]|uniref:Uncharacterized protein n=1 Tax=Sulfurovum sp. enrichment culture clone C5 TaxID=497650 RepID=A0A0S4XPU1_9BACT|nr:hypothetical protein BN3087_520010 [Sulfurovum sp. enrichment culture clone C5]
MRRRMRTPGVDKRPVQPLWVDAGFLSEHPNLILSPFAPVQQHTQDDILDSSLSGVAL